MVPHLSPRRRRRRLSAVTAVCALALLFVASPAAAQADSVERLVIWLEEGEPWEEILLDRPLAGDGAIAEALLTVRRAGYLHAAVDSAGVRPRSPSTMDVHVDAGSMVRIGSAEITANEAVTARDFYRISGLSPGDPLNLRRLEEGIERLLDEMALRGHVLASIEVADIRLEGDDEATATIVLDVDAGREAILRNVQLLGADRTAASYVMRVTGLRVGQHLNQFDAHAIRRRIIDTGLFREVGLPRLQVAADSVTLVLPVREEPPGSFDLAFGYQPAESGGTIVGSGTLELLNPFGGGRQFGLNLDRLPGQTSRLAARVSDPYLFGIPLRGAIAFSGYQQDSLFHRQRVGGEVGYAFAPGLEIFGTASRESSRPGTAGVQIDGGRQRIARSDAAMLGAGVRFTRVDYIRSPSRGLALEATAERGTNRRSQSRVVDLDTTREHRAVRQDRLTAIARSYLPLGMRGVVVGGADIHTLLSEEYDRSDFFRIGGLRTLRGYDDDRFVVRLAARGLLEYRHQLDRLSYLLAFLDMAYLERPEIPGLEPLAEWRVGYGIGAQFDTGFSLMNVALALNPSEGITTPRIHAGVSFGL